MSVTPRAFYNDTDLYCCAWLARLMKAGLIPEGDIDETPIEDIEAEWLADYAQVHLFAGIGG